MKKIDMIEIITVVTCLLFAIAISLYHISYPGYLGLSEKAWSIVWVFAENGLSLAMSVIIAISFFGIIKKMFTWLFIPYFSLKLIYHFTVYSGVYMISPKAWENIWSAVLVLLFISGLYLIFKRKHYD